MFVALSPNPLKSASNEDKVQVTSHGFRFMGSPLNEFFNDIIG
jgi:hypothetical protein